jgi:predicted flap endonuclease-1-like 5' DNA nuclease
MVALFVQTLLLMGVAYFVGAALACVIRRSLQGRAKVAPAAERRVDPLPEVLEAQPAPVRFAGRAVSEPITTPQAPPPPAAAPAAASITVPAAKTAAPAITMPAAALAPAAITAPAGEPAPAQDLKRIRQIDATLEGGLNRLGVRRYEHIAAWLKPDVDRVGRALGLGGRISQENWIEQAQVLAKGGETHYAMRLARGEAAKAAPTADEGEPPRIAPAPRASTGGAAGVVADVAIAAAAPPAAPAVAASPPAVAERAAFAERSAEAPPGVTAAAGPMSGLGPAVALRPAAPATHDNLQRISGIDAAVETALIGQGVTRYSQIAHWSPADVARLEALFGEQGRIGRENWIEQAQILSRGGDTAFSRDYDRRARGDAAVTAPRPAKLADAIREHASRSEGQAPRQTRSDLGALRSVRSEAYQTQDGAPETAQRTGYASKVVRSAPLDDLKRIRGIGVLIEKRLNSMGVVGYEQIANWTAQDIERVSQSLDFKGRIERENWVEQARILASGGATEFSRRVDRGEVETSRYRP